METRQCVWRLGMIQGRWSLGYWTQSTSGQVNESPLFSSRIQCPLFFSNCKEVNLSYLSTTSSILHLPILML